MRKISIVLTLMVMFFCASPGFSQEPPRRLLGNFIFDKNLYSYSFTKDAEDNYSLVISNIFDSADSKPAAPDTTTASNDSTVSRNMTTITNTTIVSTSLNADTTITQTMDTATTTRVIEKKDSSALEEYFSEFSQSVFTAVFERYMRKKYGISSSQSLKDKAVEVFFKIKTRLDFIDDEPITAFLILRRDTMVSWLRSNTSKYYKGKLSSPFAQHYITRVAVETEAGAIKNIIVKAIHPDMQRQFTQSPRQFIEFKNAYPINISGKYDPEKFANQNLYCFNCNGVKGLTRYIKLSDLLLLDLELENDKEDFSPSNRVFTLTPGHPIVELKKEKRSRIVEVAAFTDFVGLDRAEPNGLIQIEAKRKIFINTKSVMLTGYAKNEGIANEVNLNEVRADLLNRKKLQELGFVLRGKKWQYFRVTDKKVTSIDSVMRYATTIVRDTIKNRDTLPKTCDPKQRGRQQKKDEQALLDYFAAVDLERTRDTVISELILSNCDTVRVRMVTNPLRVKDTRSPEEQLRDLWDQMYQNTYERKLKGNKSDSRQDNKANDTLNKKSTRPKTVSTHVALDDELLQDDTADAHPPTKVWMEDFIEKSSDSIKVIKIKNTTFHSPYQTWFNYIEPRLLFSKLEDNNRFVDSVKGAAGAVSALTLYQHQLVSFGVGKQIIRLNFPQLKFQWDVLNLGAYWGRTRIARTSDSVGPTTPINSLYGEIQSRFIFRPDNRWGASLGVQYMMPKIWNPEFKLPNRYGMMQYQFDAYLKTSADSRLFFRYRWTYENKNRNTNFTQMQLGYSMQLFAGSSGATHSTKF